MRGSLRVGREQLVTRVQTSLCLETKKVAERLIHVMVSSIEETRSTTLTRTASC